MAGGAKVRANREVSVLKNLFNYAIRMHLFEGVNPCSSVKLPRKPLQRVRYLEIGEESALVEELQESLRTLVILGTHTGIRIQSEGLSLK